VAIVAINRWVVVSGSTASRQGVLAHSYNRKRKRWNGGMLYSLLKWNNWARN